MGKHTSASDTAAQASNHTPRHAAKPTKPAKPTISAHAQTLRAQTLRRMAKGDL